MGVAVNIVPHFVLAANEKQLQRKMIQIQVARGTKIAFYGIQEKKNGQWIAWFEKELKAGYGLKPKNGEKENGIP